MIPPALSAANLVALMMATVIAETGVIAMAVPTFASELRKTVKNHPIGHAVIFLDSNSSRRAGVICGEAYRDDTDDVIRVPLFVIEPDERINQVSPSRSRILSVIAPKGF